MGKTEMKLNASCIFDLLQAKKELNLKQIGNVPDERDVLVIAAIGWLLQEKKAIIVVLDDGSFSFEVDNVINDVYY